MNKLIFFGTGLVLLILSSCGNNREDAFDSLQGNWKINEVIEVQTISSQGQVSNELRNDWKGDLGTCVFDDLLMDYSMQLDEERNLSQSFSFHRTKENSGFTQVSVYTIKGSEIDFIVRFGDQTSDAHKNAKMIVLESKEVLSDTLEIETFITLNK